MPPPPAISVVGVSNSGKTTLLERLLPELARRGLRVAVVKHSHHPRLGPERPTTDTARLRAAGAARVIGVAGGGPERFPGVAAALGDADLILVEGWRALRLPTIEVVGEDGVRRDPSELGPLLLVAAAVPLAAGAPVHARDDVAGIADRIARHVGERPPGAGRA